ncbi:MAG: GNAT family N-acetyltransferase [Gemmatimonadetes bacterium]|nr:GNAT family N-acetyltransferase [Gemmatimonadota bacterium]
MVVTATAADLEEIAALVNSAYRGESSRAGWTTEADYLAGQRTDAERLREQLAATPGAVMLAMRDDDGALLGSVWLEPRGVDVWHLGMFTIRPTLQSRGLGRTLLDESERFVKSRGARRLRIAVIQLREPLIAWYERRGFRATGETDPFPYGDARSGIPLRDDLQLLVFEKLLGDEGADPSTRSARSG